MDVSQRVFISHLQSDLYPSQRTELRYIYVFISQNVEDCTEVTHTVNCPT